MKRRVLWAAALCAVVVGCHYTFDAEGTKCDEKGGCFEGFTCGSDGLCHAGADGGGTVGGGSGGGSGGGTTGGGSGGGATGGAADGGSDGGVDCSTCAGSACVGAVCRPARTACDLPEVCASGVCPPDLGRDAGAECGPATCVGSTATPVPLCDASGTCVFGAGQVCPRALACDPDGGGCLTSCVTSADCDVQSYCVSGSCQVRNDNGVACLGADECKTGHCADGVCCDQACTGACDVCNVGSPPGKCTALSKGSAGTPACATTLCDGSLHDCPATCTAAGDCVAGYYCDSTSHCVAKRADGAACVADSSCSSGHCVDGYCCNSACGGGCDVCNAPNLHGICTVLDAGVPGIGGACGLNLCDGVSGACPTSCNVPTQCVGDAGCTNTQCGGKLSAGQDCTGRPDSDCATGHCVENVCCNTGCTGVCDHCTLSGSVGLCTVAVGATDAGCTPYVCVAGNAACPSSCSTSADCRTGNWCNPSTAHCEAKLGLGVGCPGGSGSCTSGFCVEGVCCNTGCSSNCQSCLGANTGGANGSCLPVSSGLDPKSGCGVYSCNGSGSCATACGADCSSSGCKAGYYCAASQCQPQLDAGATCAVSCACKAGGCNAFFQDSDGDGYGNPSAKKVICGAQAPAGYGVDGGDCCDSDVRAHPFQTAFFTTARVTCGGFDFDCSGVEDKALPSVADECTIALDPADGCYLSCSTSRVTAGWKTSVAACGQTATYLTGGELCVGTTVTCSLGTQTVVCGTPSPEASTQQTQGCR